MFTVTECLPIPQECSSLLIYKFLTQSVCQFPLETLSQHWFPMCFILTT